MILKQTIHKARKDYSCDVCHYILNLDGFSELPLTEEELLAVEKARNNNLKILKGDKYIYQVHTFEQFSVLKMIPEIFDICIKYKLYEQ